MFVFGSTWKFSVRLGKQQKQLLIIIEIFISLRIMYLMRFLFFTRINLTLYLNTSLHVHGFDTLVLPYNTI